MDNEMAGPDAPSGADAPAETPQTPAPTSGAPDAAANGAPETARTATATRSRRPQAPAWLARRPAPPQARRRRVG